MLAFSSLYYKVVRMLVWSVDERSIVKIIKTLAMKVIFRYINKFFDISALLPSLLFPCVNCSILASIIHVAADRGKNCESGPIFCGIVFLGRIRNSDQKYTINNNESSCELPASLHTDLIDSIGLWWELYQLWISIAFSNCGICSSFLPWTNWYQQRHCILSIC